jgi:hypothetical protein
MRQLSRELLPLRCARGEPGARDRWTCGPRLSCRIREPMDNIYSKKEDDFEFEKFICWEKPILWLNEAHNLFYSAEVLYEFESIKNKHIFTKNAKFEEMFKDTLTNRGAFNYRTQRMLWAYGFENIFKGISLLKIKTSNPEIRGVPIEKIKSHNLRHLAKEAGLFLDENDTFYLGLLEKCSLWAGRYPLPTKDKQMYKKRAAMKSSEELSERSFKIWDAYVKGEIPRIECESDIIHSGISPSEINYYSNLRERSIQLFNDLNTDAK